MSATLTDLRYVVENDAVDGTTEGAVGVRAVAELSITLSNGSCVLQLIESPGVWDIDGESGEDYFREIGDEELDVLMEMLTELAVIQSPKRVESGVARLVYA